jgi:hypothetical protein
MRWLSFPGKLKLISVADFLDFGSGAFRSRIQAGTLTADQTLTLNKSGNVAVDTARSTSIQNLGAGMPIFASESPDSVASIATAAQIRSAAGLAGISQSVVADGSNKPVFALDRPFDFQNKELTGFYLANSPFSGQSGGIGIFTDRLQGAYQKYLITDNIAGNYVNWFDSSYESSAAVSSSGTTIIEIDFTNGGANDPLVYGGGLLTFHFVDYWPGGLLTPLSIQVDMRISGTWSTAGTIYPANNSASIKNSLGSLLVPNNVFVERFRYTITPRAGASQTLITKNEYFAGRPGSDELPQYLLTASSSPITAKVPALSIEDKSGTAKTTIGPGTIQINNGGKLNGIESIGPVTISSPGASWSFAWAKALVGDLVEIIPKDGSSAAVTGRCSTAGTVSADTSSIANGTSIELRILRTAA